MIRWGGAKPTACRACVGAGAVLLPCTWTSPLLPSASPPPQCPALLPPQIKQVLMHTFGFSDNVQCHLSASLCAGFLAVLAGSPFDVVKSRSMGARASALAACSPARQWPTSWCPCSFACRQGAPLAFTQPAATPCNSVRSPVCQGRIQGRGGCGGADPAEGGAAGLLERHERQLRAAGLLVRERGRGELRIPLCIPLRLALPCN